MNTTEKLIHLLYEARHDLEFAMNKINDLEDRLDKLSKKNVQEEQEEHALFLAKTYPDKKINNIKELRGQYNIGLLEAKNLYESQEWKVKNSR